ncbi:MAG TPA: NUDIX hydrolase [Xanthomonadales bacterium]|nr:NUDIX hydrolase [Xanthomonadales bacterium]
MNNTTCLHAGRFLGLFEIDGWEYVSRQNASGVVVLVAVNDAGQLLLVEQFRPPVRKSVIELPAGLVGDLDDPTEGLLQAAQRELLEETGYAAGQLELLMSCPSSAGMSDEVISFVMASKLQQRGPGGGDASEDITVHAIALAEVDQWLTGQLRRGRLLDPKIYTALYWLEKRQHNPASVIS